MLDSFESEAGKQQMLELSEKIRIDATVFEHNILRVRDEQIRDGRDRYLAVLRGALLDQHYLENELRIEYLLDRIADDQKPQLDHLRAPESFMRKDLRRLQEARAAGQSRDGDSGHRLLPVHRDGRGEARAARRRALDVARRRHHRRSRRMRDRTRRRGDLPPGVPRGERHG